LIASTSARLADRYEEVPLSRQAILLQLLLTRDFLHIDRAESLRLGRKDESSLQSVIHEAAVRRSIGHLVKSLTLPLVENRATRRAKERVKQESSLSLSSSSEDIKVDLERNVNTESQPTRLCEPLAVYGSITRACGWALADSLRNRSGNFESSLSADKYIHSFLLILVDETAKRLSIGRQDRIVLHRSSKTVNKSRKDKERAILHLAIELANAFTPLLASPIAFKSKDAVNAANAIISNPSDDITISNNTIDVQNVGARWIYATNAALETEETTKKMIRNERKILIDQVKILKSRLC